MKTLKLNKSQVALLNQGTKVSAENDYFFLPYWFKQETDNTFKSLRFDEMPEDLKNRIREQFKESSVCDISDFETDLLNLINVYTEAGLKKPDLIKKMEYVTQSCRVS